MINESLEKGSPIRPDVFIRAVYRGVLGRDPDEGALESYGKAIDHLGWEGVIKEVSASKEASEKRKGEYSEEFIRAVYRGVLGRDPDEEALEVYGQGIESLGWEGMLREVSESKEAWEKRRSECLEEFIKRRSLNGGDVEIDPALKEQLISGLFRGLLRREPRPDELDYHVRLIGSQSGLERILLILMSSEEFRKHRRRIEIREQYTRRNLKPESEIFTEIESHECFIHIQKTGGTSLQNMLTEAFGEENILHEHSDTLYYRSPSELSQYRMLAGHYNYDSMAYLPFENLRLFTFVRDPKERLLSWYTFLRAHQPDAPVFGMGNHFANQCSIEEFLQHERIAGTVGAWNHMTWCVMGNHQWKHWKVLLMQADAEDREQLLEEFRLAIRNRLAEFLFVGLQEDYNRSCEVLFRLLEVEQPRIRADHSVQALSEKHRHFKTEVKPILTDSLHAVMDRLVELDTILYQEAKINYGRVLKELGYEEGASVTSSMGVRKS